MPLTPILTPGLEPLVLQGYGHPKWGGQVHMNSSPRKGTDWKGQVLDNSQASEYFSKASEVNQDKTRHITGQTAAAEKPVPTGERRVALALQAGMLSGNSSPWE